MRETNVVTRIPGLLAAAFIAMSAALYASPFADEVPQTLREVWDFFPEMDENTDLDVEVIREWDEGDVHVRLIGFTAIELEGVKTRIVGYYAYPQGGEDLPAILHVNGGPERAFVRSAVGWAEKGYAAFNPHLSDTAMSNEDDKSIASDWGLLYTRGKRIVEGAAIPWERNKTEKQKQTFDPRNDPYYARIVAARRCISFLAAQPEVDRDRIGMRGHSTGGVLTVHTMIDPRLSAAVPSVGGPGYWYTPLKYRVGTTRGQHTRESDPGWYDTMARQLYWRRVQCPVLFLGASNDFNSPLDNIAKAIQEVPHDRKRLIVAPRRNHSFNPEAEMSAELWFAQHLGVSSFQMPQAPRAELLLDAKDGIPRYRLWPDPNTGHEIEKVEIYYAYDRNPQSRYWSDAGPERRDGYWEGKCPVFYDDEPLFAFGNVYYRQSGGEGREFMLTSPFEFAFPEDMRAAGVRPTEKRHRIIMTDGEIEGEGPFSGKEWSLGSGRLVDPRWMAPQGATLDFEIYSSEPGNWIGICTTRRYHGVNNGEMYYYAWVKLDSKGWNSLSLEKDDFRNNIGRPVDKWYKCTSINIASVPVIEKSYRKFLPRAGDRKVESLPADAEAWRGEAARIRDLHWAGGDCEAVSKPWERE